MLTAEAYNQLIDQLTSRFYDYEKPSSLVRMVGIVFASPNSPLAKSEIIPQIADWHYRSGNHIDFFFAGYSPTSSKLYSEVQVQGPDPWFYNPEAFHELRLQIENRTKWQFGGECELLLTNARVGEHFKTVDLDFSSTICCQLNKMKEDKAISSVADLFESVFRFAESATGEDPTWGISDRLGIKIARSALKRVVLGLLPKELGGDFRKAEYFAVRNVGI